MFSIVAGRLDGLRRRYAEPHRRYHTQRHVDTLLDGLAAARGMVRHPAVVELAIWYHDAIYDPAAGDNEARSAALLRSEMTGLAASEVVEAAALMVEATADHRVPAGLAAGLAEDAALFMDLDMAVLGAGADEYDAYEAGIAGEFVPVHGLAAFRRGRLAFLRGVLGQERLFRTPGFHAALDGAARANLRRAAAALQAAEG